MILVEELNDFKGSMAENYVNVQIDILIHIGIHA